MDSLAEALDFEFYKIVPNDTPVSQSARDQLSYFTAELFDGRIFRLDIGSKAGPDDNFYYANVEMDLRADVTDDTLKKEVEAFNQRSKSRLYAFNNWVGTKFVKKLSDLLETKEES